MHQSIHAPGITLVDKDARGKKFAVQPAIGIITLLAEHTLQFIYNAWILHHEFLCPAVAIIYRDPHNAKHTGNNRLSATNTSNNSKLYHRETIFDIEDESGSSASTPTTPAFLTKGDAEETTNLFCRSPALPTTAL